MGFERSMWRGLTGGGEVSVVRCWCSQEKARFSFRSVGEECRPGRVSVSRWWGEWFVSLGVVMCFLRLTPLRPLQALRTLSDVSVPTAAGVKGCRRVFECNTEH